MKKHVILLSICFLFISAACSLTTNFGYQTLTGSGEITTESWQVSGFEHVKVCCGMELYLTQGGTQSLEIEADDNLIDEIVTTVVDGTLDVRYQRMINFKYQPTQAVRVYVTMSDVQGVSLSGGGYFETDSISSEVFDLEMSGGSDAWIAELASSEIGVHISGGGKLKAAAMQGDQVMMSFSGGSDAQIGDLVTSNLDVNNSGGGEFEVASCETGNFDLVFTGGSDAEILSLMAEKLNVDVSGGGIIEISGIVMEQEITLSGGSSYKAGDLHSEHTSFSASGGGDSTVWVTETLSVQLTGDSDLAYYGQPQIFNPSFSRGSELNPLGERE